MIDMQKLGLGIAGSVDHHIVRELAPMVEAAGFRTFWLNDTPTGDSLAGLKVAAEVTTTLELGTGVIPLDRKPAGQILEDLANLDLPVDRLWLGVGTGHPKGGLARIRENVALLREGTTAKIVVGALGPNIRQLGAEVTDGLLLNWLTPDAAAEAMDDLRHVAETRGTRPVRGILYARTAVTAAGLRAMVAEGARYQSIPQYAENFARIGARAIDTTIYEKEPERLAYRIGQYTSVVDELVLRATTGEQDLTAYAAFVETISQAAQLDEERG
jgi:alkanesulfonate monooxygenase SsuD/methylene tetrahydromethanopterin reductase-like flavin-dependent oxidoreductase (luciferase family)